MDSTKEIKQIVERTIFYFVSRFPYLNSQHPLHLSILFQFTHSKFNSIKNQMQPFTPSSKLKKASSGNIVSHLATYQGEIIRNSGTINSKKQKTNRRVITEHSEKTNCITSQIKSATKQFKLPFKSTSPKLKKNMAESHSTSNKKLAFMNSNLTKKKPTQPSKPNLQKVNTEAGGLIKKKKINQGEKKILFSKEQKTNVLKQGGKKQFSKKQQKVHLQYGLDKKAKSGAKKLKECKSLTNLTESIKTRLKTEGTFDSTPYILGGNDIQILGLIGQGTFGKVYKGRIIKTGQFVAIKKVFQDPKYKNRQIEIVSMLDAQFVMKVIGTYTTFQNGSQYLSIIMEYYDCDLFNYIKNNGKKGLNTFDIKLITYQIFRGLNYIHSLGVCHRDIKPHNVLVKGKKAVICDFGSAKVLTNEPNLPYICSRCYRAPELIFGATHYTTMIDIWSVGCVILEMIQGFPLFIGESSIDHLIEIIKVMGTPTKTQVIDMNPEYDLNDYKFPKIKRKDWEKIFPKADSTLLDLISKIMIYSPQQRLSAAQALCHQFYDQLRDEKTYKHIQQQYGIELFSFTQQELKGKEHLVEKLFPDWLRE